jgi:hypothetical protein
MMIKRIIFIIILFCFLANAHSQIFGLNDAVLSKTPTGSYSLNLNTRVVGIGLNSPFIQMDIGTKNTQSFGLYQNNIQRILLNSVGTNFTGGLVWNSPTVNNATSNALVIDDLNRIGYRSLSNVAFTGNYASLIGVPMNTLASVTANGAITANILSLGNYSATNGSVLLKANYDEYNAQAIITERGSGAIGLSAYMYQDNSTTWLSSYNYGAIPRSAFLVAGDGIKFISAPSQSVGPNNALTTQPTSVFTIDNVGRAIFAGSVTAKSYGSGLQNGLTNKLRIYDAGGVLESETDNSFGFGINHSTGRMAISAGQNGYINFFTQNIKRLSVEHNGDVSVVNSFNVGGVINTQYIRSNSGILNGYVEMNTGNGSRSGYINFFTPNQIWASYIGFAENGGNTIYEIKNGAKHQFVGDAIFLNIINANGGINMKASPLSLYTSNISSDGNNLNLKGNVSNTKNVSITSNNELNATLTPFTAYSANDVTNDNQTVAFVSGDVVNLPAATKAVRMVNAQGTTNTGVTINLNVPTMKSKEQVLVFSGVGLAFNANVVFNAPSGWFIYSGGSLAASRTFTSQQTIDAGQGCIYRVLFFTSDNTISIMRIKDN